MRCRRGALVVAGMSAVAAAWVLSAALVACRSGSGEAADAGESVGVRECDAWLAKRDGCLAAIDRGARDTLRARLDAERAEVRESARTAEGRAALASTCRRLLEELSRECR